MQREVIPMALALVVVLLLLGAPTAAADPTPDAAPGETEMRTAVTDAADWLMTVTQASGQPSPPPGAPAWEGTSGGRLSEVGLALVRAFQVTGTQAYMDRAEAIADLALDCIDAGKAYVIDRTGVLVTEAGGGFVDVMSGKVDDAHVASFTGDVRFNLWESMAGIMLFNAMFELTEQTKYANGMVLLDRLVGGEFYMGDSLVDGMASHVTLSNGGTYTKGNLASTTDHAVCVHNVATAAEELPNLYKDQYDLLNYVNSLAQPDGSFDDKTTLPGQTSSSETRHGLMIWALFELGLPTKARGLSDWVESQQQTNGSLACPHDGDWYGDTAWAAVGLLPSGQVASGGDALSWLVAEQETDGSWSHIAGVPRASDTASTAWAVVALHTGLTNYNLVVQDTSVATEMIWGGDPPRVVGHYVNVTVANEGLVSLTGVDVRVYDGPRSGGDLIDEATVDVPGLGETLVPLEFRPGERGPHDIHVWVVYADGGEFKTRDNNVTVPVNINREPTGAIASPTEGQLFPFEENILFEAAEVVDLDGDAVNLTWTDNVTGLISHQPSFTAVLPPGEHEVTLTFNDFNGPSTSANVSFSIRYNIPPTIRISTPANDSSYYDYQTVPLNASASSDAENHPLSVSWFSDRDGFLGDGAAIGRRLSVGRHVITCYVNDGYDNASRQVVIRVMETYPPEISIDSPVVGGDYVSTTRVEFDATGTTDPDSEILEYFWTSNIDGLLSERPAFLAFLTVGTHRITLAVNDGNYNVTETFEILVNDNRPPVVLISNPINEDEFYSDELVELNGSASYDPEDFVTYFWVSDRRGYLGDEAVVEVHLPRGEQRITLFVNDSHGHNESATITVHVLNLGPEAGISSPVSGAVFEEGEEIDFNSANSTDPEGDMLTYAWSVRLVGADWVPFGNEARASRLFDKTGTYEIMLSVSDGRGGEDESAITITVEEASGGTDDSPGFGALAALAAICALASVAADRRRRRR